MEGRTYSRLGFCELRQESACACEEQPLRELCVHQQNQHLPSAINQSIGQKSYVTRISWALESSAVHPHTHLKKADHVRCHASVRDRMNWLRRASASAVLTSSHQERLPHPCTGSGHHVLHVFPGVSPPRKARIAASEQTAGVRDERSRETVRLPQIVLRGRVSIGWRVGRLSEEDAVTGTLLLFMNSLSNRNDKFT